MDNLNLTDLVSISNHIHRRLGRQIGLWAWQSFEVACSFVLPWLVAGELSPARSIEATLAAAQQRITQLDEQLDKILKAGVQAPQQAAQDPVPNVIQPPMIIQNQVVQQVVNQAPARSLRDLCWDAINYSIATGLSFIRNSPYYLKQTFKFLAYTALVGTVRASYRAIKWVDGTISSTLGAMDEFLNRRFKGIPGYRLLTWYPLRLGNWEHTYKQSRNYAFFVNPLWLRFVKPFLAKHVFFADMAKAVSSYVAPYAELGVRVTDKAFIGFLSTVSNSAANYGLEAFAKSFSGWWNSRPISTQLFHSSVTLSDSFIPVRLTTVEIEAAAERHIDFLASSAAQAMDKLSVMNGYIHGYADPIMTLMSTMVNDAYRFGNCIMAAHNRADIISCLGKVQSNFAANYWTPFTGLVQGYVMTPLWNSGNDYVGTPFINFVYTNGWTRPIAENISYFYECSTTGNGGYVDFGQAPCLEKIQGVTSCSLSAGQYAINNGLNAILNSGTGLWSQGCYGIDTLVTRFKDGVECGVKEVAKYAMENPGTAAAVVGAAIAVPAVVFCVHFTAKTAYERMFYPNGRQHVVHHGQVGVAVNGAANPGL